MNTITYSRRLQIIKCLADGAGVRATARIVGVSPTTVLRHLRLAGSACQKFLDEVMKNLSLTDVQIDEQWTFVRMKQPRANKLGRGAQTNIGDIFIWLALDRPTRLIPTYLAAKRDQGYCAQFLWDLRNRIIVPTQICTDGWRPYPHLIAEIFPDSSHVVEIKNFPLLDKYRRRYAPPRVRGVVRKTVLGDPGDDATISHCERFNLFHRMRVRRLTRMCDGFSKRLENLRLHLALHLAVYNFCWIHRSIKCSPAMEAGLTSRLWDIEDLLEVLDSLETPAAA